MITTQRTLTANSPSEKAKLTFYSEQRENNRKMFKTLNDAFLQNKHNDPEILYSAFVQYLNDEIQTNQAEEILQLCAEAEEKENLIVGMSMRMRWIRQMAQIKVIKGRIKRDKQTEESAKKTSLRTTGTKTYFLDEDSD